jgi:N-acyl-D-amino-acid deacylase
MREDRRKLRTALVLLSAAFGAALVVATPTARPQSSAPADFDIVISNGRIVDGTGAPWFRGDVGLQGDRIRAIGNLSAASTRRRIDASNLVVAPGFIDMLGQSEFCVLVDNRAASKITQGVTTEVTGEGASIGPVNERMIEEASPVYKAFGIVADWRTLGEYFRRLDERTHPAINLASFVGAGGVRNYVVGEDNRPATPQELARMKDLVAQAMEQGALGLSSSLQYMPDRFATTDELIALAGVAARYGGVYLTHQRSEARSSSRSRKSSPSPRRPESRPKSGI